MPHTDLNLRSYTTRDLDACLGIFDSNLPLSLTPGERDAFAKEIGSGQFAYFVVEDETGKVVSCGGHDLKIATLCWGMVDLQQQGKNIGRFLLLARLRQIFDQRGEVEVHLDTSQYAKGFYEHHGFKVVAIQENHYAPGVHRHDMTLALDNAYLTRFGV